MKLTDEEALLATLADEERKRRSQMRSLLALWLGIFAGIAVLFCAYWLVKGPPDLVLVSLAISSFATFPLLFSISSRHRQAAEQALQFEDPRVVPRFLDLLDCDSAALRKSAKGVLLRNLPLVDAESCSAFDRRHLHQLATLAGSANLNLARRAVSALSKVGDLQSIRDLEVLRGRRSKKLLEGVISQSLADLRLRLAGTEIRRDPQFNRDLEVRAALSETSVQ